MHPTISLEPARSRVLGLLAAALLVLLAAPVLAHHDATSRPEDASQLVLLAQASADDEGGKLEPRYQPREPEPKSNYNSSYVFGMTRGVADSTIHPAVKAPLFLFTLPLDLVLMPFAALGGLFG